MKSEPSATLKALEASILETMRTLDSIHEHALPSETPDNKGLALNVHKLVKDLSQMRTVVTMYEVVTRWLRLIALREARRPFGSRTVVQALRRRRAVVGPWTSGRGSRAVASRSSLTVATLRADCNHAKIAC